jgi:transcription factor-like protein
MVDLELIHNFTTFTHATLSSDPAVRQMMRTNAVRMALGCDYVMRALLAVSALHLAHYRPERRDFYVARALQHHQIASQAAIPSMSDLSYDNCENLHLFSVLTLYFGTSSSLPPPPSLLIPCD